MNKRIAYKHGNMNALLHWREDAVVLLKRITKPFFILTIAFIHVNAINAQQLQGIVVNKRNLPIANASISIKNSYDGAITDSTGKFSFTHTIIPGDTIEVSIIGYKTFQKALDGSNTLPLKISLSEEINEMQAVVIKSAGAFMSGNNKKGVVVSPLDIVTISQNGDITTALKMFPGTQQVGEQEGLFVRGGTASETKQYMDGAVITSPYFRGPENVAQRGRYNPFLFDGTLFSTGGYSALYGDALSSVGLLNTIDLPERSDMMFTISPLMLEAGTQQLSKNGKSSFGANYRFTFAAPYFQLIKPRTDYFEGPTYHVADANFRIKTKGGMIKFFTSFDQNHVGMRDTDNDSAYLKDQTHVRNYNLYTNIHWQETLANRWKLNWSNSFSVNKDDIARNVVNQNNDAVTFADDAYWMWIKNLSVNDKRTDGETRFVLEKRLKQLDALRFGMDYHYMQDKMIYNDTAINITDHSPNLFAEFDHYFSNKLATTIGIRGGYTSVIRQFNIAPRLSIVYKVGTNQQISGAYGIFYQQPDALYLLRTKDLDYSVATHYILNYTWMTKTRILRAELYYKNYDKLIKTVPLGNTGFSYNSNGYGYAKGIDIFWKDKQTIPGFEYWLSYSYIDTKRIYLDYTSELQPSYATPHTASVVLKRFIMPIKTQFNLTYAFATGRPYYYFQQQNNVFKKLDEGTTKPYNNVGFSVNYIPFVGNEKKKTHVILVATVSNLLGTKQIFNYTYSYDGMKKYPVISPARQFFFLGLFLNIGTDRTQQIINDNL